MTENSKTQHSQWEIVRVRYWLAVWKVSLPTQQTLTLHEPPAKTQCSASSAVCGVDTSAPLRQSTQSSRDAISEEEVWQAGQHSDKLLQRQDRVIHGGSIGTVQHVTTTPGCRTPAGPGSLREPLASLKTCHILNTCSSHCCCLVGATQVWNQTTWLIHKSSG